CKAGRPCRAWAVRNSEEPLCASHRKSRPRLARPRAARPVPAIVLDCHARLREASHREDGQRPHQAEAGTLGFYEGAFSVEDATGQLHKSQARHLEDELTLTRVAVRHALLQLQQDLDPAEFILIIKLIFRGTRTIANILRIQRSISGDQDDLPRPEIAAALDDLSAKWGVDL
ncbi:MAG: hypothetical protein PVH18_13245, partial [Chloroflexota bacterium]